MWSEYISMLALHTLVFGLLSTLRVLVTSLRFWSNRAKIMWTEDAANLSIDRLEERPSQEVNNKVLQTDNYFVRTADDRTGKIPRGIIKHPRCRKVRRLSWSTNHFGA